MKLFAKRSFKYTIMKVNFNIKMKVYEYGIPILPMAVEERKIEYSNEEVLDM